MCSNESVVFPLEQAKHYPLSCHAHETREASALVLRISVSENTEIRTEPGLVRKPPVGPRSEWLKHHQPEDERQAAATDHSQEPGIDGGKRDGELLIRGDRLRRFRIYLWPPSPCLPQELPNAIEGTRANAGHSEADENQQTKGSPDPAVTPPVAHKACCDPGGKQRQQGDIRDSRRTSGNVEQRPHPRNLAFATHLEGDGGGGAVGEQESEDAEDMCKDEPLI